MQVEKYLQKNQPIIYKIFKRTLENNQLSHAYLLSGNPGTPLFETAMFLAKSIVCDDASPFACNSCITCLRIEDNNYPDFLIFDGSKASIKKEEIVGIEAKFEKTAFETKGKKIYILHLIENTSVEAINSVLKFLEEPGENVFAFLTTNNENSVLPTIISRCQTLRLKLVDRETVIKEAIELGVASDDAELLSYFYNDCELIYDVINDEDRSEIYKTSKEAYRNFLEALCNDDYKEALFYAQKNIIPIVKTKESARFFLDMLSNAFKDILSLQNGGSIILNSYATILETLANKLTNADQKITEILKDRNLINLNVNTSLLMDHVVLALIKEDIEDGK